MQQKTCRKCQQIKPIDEFVKHKLCKDGRANDCKICSNAYKVWWSKTPTGEIKRLEAKRKHNATIRRHNTEKRRVLYKKYGLTLEDFQTMRMLQLNKCLICEDDEKELVVDHDHKTGKVRGLLCRQCNSALGLFKEDLQTLEKAISYVSKHLHNK